MTNEPTATESTREQLQALQENLPGLLEVLSSNYQPTEQRYLDARRNLAPQEQQLAIDTYRQFAPDFQAIDEQSRTAQAESDARLMGGAGQELTRQTLATQQVADPEFFANRALIGSKQTELLNSMSPDSLSGGERAEIERAQNRSNIGRGTQGTGSPTATIEAAMTTGSALNARKTALSNALTQATQFLPNLKSGIDVFQTTTGKPSMPQAFGALNTGTNTQNNSGIAGQFAQSMLGNIQQTQANRRDSLDRANETMGSIPT